MIVAAKSCMAQGQFKWAVTGFHQARLLAGDLDNGNIKAMLNFWQKACEIIRHDFSRTEDFEGFQNAYRVWRETSEDDRFDQCFSSIEPFCLAWLYLCGPRKPEGKSIIEKVRDDTEEESVPMGVAAHMACEYALCYTPTGKLSIALGVEAKEQFVRFVSCMEKQADKPSLHPTIRECYRNTAIRINDLAKGEMDVHLAAEIPADTDDLLSAVLSIEQCQKFHRETCSCSREPKGKRRKMIGHVLRLTCIALTGCCVWAAFDMWLLGVFVGWLGFFVNVGVRPQHSKRFLRWMVVINIVLLILFVLLLHWCGTGSGPKTSVIGLDKHLPSHRIGYCRRKHKAVICSSAGTRRIVSTCLGEVRECLHRSSYVQKDGVGIEVHG